MHVETVREIFRRLNAGGVRYVVIGGLAYSEYAPPRATQDVDVIVLAEDEAKVRQLFPGCYQRGTAVAGIYEFEGTKFDVQPARRRVQAGVLKNSVDSTFEGEPIRIATLRDLIFLKLWASMGRPELSKKALDLADVTAMLEHNATAVSAADIRWIVESILALGYTPEEAARCREAVAWLNGTLGQLGLPGLRFPPA